MQRSTLLHLRIPFSFFLMPVFLFALSISASLNSINALLAFLILHLLLYPASNGYNSYFDKDEGSIGGLKTPPKVTKELYRTSLALDALAILIGAYFINQTFAIMLLIYGLASKAYSHPLIRLKKYAILGWFTIFFFQGYFTFLMSYVGIMDSTINDAFRLEVQFPAILSSILLGGSYPMTQIYQHEEDDRRGDMTISRLLGILGTFHFTALMFAIATGGFYYYFLIFYELKQFLFFQAMLLPALLFFAWWYLRVRNDQSKADYGSTMKLNFISSVMLNLYFLISIMMPI